MIEKVATMLVKRFDEPLSEDDISSLAKLMRLDGDAQRVAVGLAGPDGAIDEAIL